MMSPALDILLVEDEPAIVDFMERTLRRAGYSVRSVADGVSALAVLDSGAPGVLILDLTLPRLSGWAILEHLRRAEIDIPTIVVTANPHAFSCLRIYNVHSFLLKPFRLDDLLDAVGASSAQLTSN